MHSKTAKNERNYKRTEIPKPMEFIRRIWACSSGVVKALCYKPESRGFKTPMK
jgi:hypothetical protein